jgi:hypothetical protein
MGTLLTTLTYFFSVGHGSIGAGRGAHRLNSLKGFNGVNMAHSSASSITLNFSGKRLRIPDKQDFFDNMALSVCP